MKTASEPTPSIQFTVNPVRPVRRPRDAPKSWGMNWLTLVALSATAASGAAHGDQPTPPAPSAIVAQADKAAEEVQLDGVVLPRADGGFLQVKMEGMNLVLRTYDAKKKAVPVDVDRATVRLIFAARAQEQYTLARSADGMALTVGRPIRAPHVFRANIALFRGDSSEAVESFQVAYP